MFLLLGSMVLALVILDVLALATTLPALANAGSVGDWIRLAHVDPAAPYANDFYRWAPPAIWIWRTVIEPVGFWPVFALHFVAIAFLRPRLCDPGGCAQPGHSGRMPSTAAGRPS